jgi:hypothetical protein
MLMSKCPLKKLTAATVQHLWAKFLEIHSHRFIDVLTVGVLGEAQEPGGDGGGTSGAVRAKRDDEGKVEL